MSKINLRLTFASLLFSMATTFAGCDDSIGVEDARSVRVDLTDLDSLSNDEFYVIDAHDEIVYHIAPAAAARARSRVMLIAGDGENILLDDALRMALDVTDVDSTEFLDTEMSISIAQPEDESARIAPKPCGDYVIIVNGKPVIVKCGWPK